ncbi:hypothetical protein [Haloarcula sp. JP-L23]|uniref:hypothetical protein n=1 Tax=Haloarcula sp. JP-L23 TaxID=2716717 RepID=UPI00140F10B5|nr:hypothetical protein G9465_19315 [Haloarcula sp. JP-L23]
MDAEPLRQKLNADQSEEIAVQLLENDVRQSIERWLKDDYEAAANEYTKQEMLELVDDMIARLETLAQTSNQGQGRDSGGGQGQGGS